jgi:hypothetical protein
MTATQERFERIERNLEKVAELAHAIGASVIAHDGQIDKLLQAAQAHGEQIAQLARTQQEQQKQWEQLRREFQAYLTTVHPRQ